MSLGTCLLVKPAHAFWAEFAAKFVWQGVEYFIEKISDPNRKNLFEHPSGARRAVPWKVCVEIPGDDRLYVHDTPDWETPNIGVLTDGEEVLQIDEGFAKNGRKWAKILYKRYGYVKSGWVNKSYLIHPDDVFANCWQ